MKCADFEVKFRNIGYLLYYSDLIKGNKMCGKRWNVRILKLNFEILDIYFTIIVILKREIKCVENYEMCGFWKLNYKILDKNLTIVLLHREVKCVENDEMCGFWSEISKYWIFTLL